MRVKDYTIAVTDLICSGKDIDQTLSSLKLLLMKRGHARIYPKILSAVSAELSAREQKSGARLTIARKEHQATLSHEIEKATNQIGLTIQNVTIDPTLIGGYLIEGGGRRLDHSYKHSLLTLYRSLIS